MSRNLTLVSTDDQLASQCREFVRVCRREGWTLVLDPEGTAPVLDGVCLWDYNAAAALPDWHQRTEARLFYLVEAADAGKLPVPKDKMILKPVSPRVLMAFLANNASDINFDLQQYDRLREESVARTVHDLRTPLAAVAGACQLMTSGQLGPLTAMQRDALEVMQRSVKRLLRMNSALLDLRTTEEPRPRPPLEQGDMLACIEQACQEVRGAWTDKNISVCIVESTPPAAGLYFEADAMIRVLINLLENAYKATARNGSITITGRSHFWQRRVATPQSLIEERRRHQSFDSNSYRITVRDSGPGLPAGWRLDEPRSGLGLAICQSILRWHEGAIWAEDSASGGASLTLVIPYQRKESIPARNKGMGRIDGQSRGPMTQAGTR